MPRASAGMETVSPRTVLFIADPLVSSNIEVLTGTARIVILPNVKTSIDPRVLKGIAAPVALPSDKTSIDVSILLNGVCDVNGVPLLVVRK